MNHNNYSGYIFSRDFFPGFVPQRVQNLVIRQFVSEKGGTFSLSATEKSEANSYSVLDTVLDELNESGDLVFYSLYFLPKEKNERQQIFKKVLKNGSKIHFALENISIESAEGILAIEEIFLAEKVSQRATLPKKHLRYREFVTTNHLRGKRDYLARVNEFSKAECAIKAKKFGRDYWDGERQFGYGGYSYDGRWEAVANKMIDTYGLSNNSSVLDIGCGKGYLLFELKKSLPGMKIQGLDISSYAIANAKEEIAEILIEGNAEKLPFEDSSFDLVISNTTFHNLKIPALFSALKEVVRVSAKDSWLCVESYRNEVEKMNLLYWQLTCESFYSPEEWQWIFDQTGYSGDYEFIYFT